MNSVSEHWIFAWRVMLIIGLMTLMGGCASSNEKDDVVAHWSLERLYAEAKGALDIGSYQKAVKYYEILEARYPFSVYAQQSLLDLAYAYYKASQSEAAQAASERFLKLYPQNQYIDYVYYLKGLINDEKGQGFVERYFPLDLVQRNLTAKVEAFQNFMQLLRKFPNSKYVDDARDRMVKLREQLAEHEVNVAHYYLRQGAFVASANRAAYVIKNYPQSAAVPEALILLSKSYKIMGLDQLSQDALRVMRMNYPHHPGIDEVTSLVVAE